MLFHFPYNPNTATDPRTVKSIYKYTRVTYLGIAEWGSDPSVYISKEISSR